MLNIYTLITYVSYSIIPVHSIAITIFNWLILLFLSQGKNCSSDINECLSVPCLNGGTCTEPAPNMFSCRCPPGVSGNTCNEVRFATFGGNNFVQVSTDSTNTRIKRAVDTLISGEIDLAFSFETTVKGGLILYAAGVSKVTIFSHSRNCMMMCSNFSK